MLVLGLDPGLERMGFGLVRRSGSRLTSVAYGLLSTPRVSTPERLVMLEQQLCKVLEAHRPDAVACERLFFAKNQTTVFDVAKALGVAQLVCARAGLGCLEITPPEVKLAVVGHGGAEKAQVQFMVQRLLGLAEPPRPDDVADALAVAICLALRPLGPAGAADTPDKAVAAPKPQTRRR
ncbi:MAG: crossover junction endodeoxyribonuclease RuvC [Fimbriimonadaceae bacterium]|nr:crossover junction endodeoxyribonuclease RuvC [Fimbriimonadaceae bacterium]QYK56139.1 MAG: crossover junction endodeoxyribonuclease RuvC [Fimbriimonadaceae bacterium]